MNENRTTPTLAFFGATETVTGSRFLIEAANARVLVDCGLYQGVKALRERNWQAFPIKPDSIDAVILTHAHVDHSGYLPALVRDGFRGPIYATPGTIALAGIVLPDCGHLQEEDASYANRRNFSKHHPALPLYTQEDAVRSLSQFRPVDFERAVEVARGVKATFCCAGHILGSATVTIELEGKPSHTILFSGDLGRPYHPILRPPAPPPAANIVVVESTYGDRRHDDAASLQRFEEAIVRTAARKGMVLIPSFAVDRTEVILIHLRRLMAAKRIPNLPVYVDSPMALASLAVYRQALSSHSNEIRKELALEGDPFDPGNLIEVPRAEDSRAINENQGPGIIIAASGMATGGRVLHHLLNRLPHERNTVLLVGFQATGTRGRALVDGARSIKLLGRYVGVRAEVVNVPAFSVHADQQEIVDWLRQAPHPPDTLFIVHGEPEAAAGLRTAVEKSLEWNVAIPRFLERVRLD